MKSQHTKGELFVATIDSGEANDEIITHVNDCMVNICEVFGEGIFSESRQNGEKEPHYKVSKAEAKANAKRLAQCWNSHDALVEALELALMGIEAAIEKCHQNNDTNFIGYALTSDKIKVALKSAKGE
jgi:hypothetical protein